jgi:hypothetical protein
MRVYPNVPEITVDAFTNSTFVNLADSNPAPVTFGAGDSVGLVAIGDRIEAWYKAAAGSWMPIIGVTDTTYRNPGLVMLGIRDNEARLDDFYAGEIT